MIDRSYIGHKREPLTVAVEPFQLRLFAKAIGETNPIYLEAEAAKAAGYRNMLAPPTFANALSMSSPDPFGDWPAMGIELAKVLHGEQKFEYFAPICAGDTITCRMRLPISTTRMTVPWSLWSPRLRSATRTVNWWAR